MNSRNKDKLALFIEKCVLFFKLIWIFAYTLSPIEKGTQMVEKLILPIAISKLPKLEGK